MKKMVLVITGAAGSGKTTLCKYICNKFHLPKVVTHTTRAPRTGEQNGVDYYFETDDSFAKRHFLESVDYAGAQYGSSLEGLEAAWKTASLACIVLDTKGAIEYQRQLGSQVITIYLTVDNGKNSAACLRKRMEERGDDPEKIAKRMQSAENQRDQQLPAELKNHAVVIKNDDLTVAKQQVDTFMDQLRVQLKS
ncbi:guanylate kinase [Lactobacillus sp. Sy-1]|uniref:guanylate kinase n=1 Tax=Lactobacillus sp. Sy-1 TaxID=2109645 RepID=UPI001C56911A|nr:guanylate kinase [Lactobacillus sp. Sy-1]MBW1605277.1 50S ribosome-binding GTPase [Lactobacillus sp. Sy-1]